MADYFIAFWNVENLFDVAGQVAPHRPEHLQKRLKNELKGWTATILGKKLKQLAKIIGQMNGGVGPDILGFCEVENENVLDALAGAIDLPNRDYGVAHENTKDGRGIDLAFLFDKAKFRKKEQFSHAILKRTSTRDLFQVNFETKPKGNLLILVANHWPARSAGQYESEPYRILAGETLSYWHKRIVEIVGSDAAILAMGDFNDEPFARSLTDYALSTYQRNKVTKGATRLFNLMWPALGRREGTYYYRNFAAVLDQFLASKGLLKRDLPLRVLENSVQIEVFDEMKSGGAYPAPIRFGRPSKGLNENGFSDHYPISAIVREAE